MPAKGNVIFSEGGDQARGRDLARATRPAGLEVAPLEPRIREFTAVGRDSVSTPQPTRRVTGGLREAGRGSAHG